MLIFELLQRELNVNVMQWCANYTLQAVILRESLLNLFLRLSPFVSLSNHIRLRTFETTFDEPENLLVSEKLSLKIIDFPRVSSKRRCSYFRWLAESWLC